MPVTVDAELQELPYDMASRVAFDVMRDVFAVHPLDQCDAFLGYVPDAGLRSGQEDDGQEYGQTGSYLFILLSPMFLSARWGLDLSLADRWSFS
jgi:hypothetical protein